MNKIYICIFAAILAFTALTIPCSAEDIDLNETMDLTRLVTSNYKDAFMTVDTAGDTVKISGVFKNDRIKNIYFPLISDTKCSFNTNGDGTFTGDITAKPFENGYYTFAVVFESRLIYSYTLKYNDGWSVPDNGIAEANARKLENITSAPPVAAAYYLSAEADKTEIEETLTELEAIVEEVCGDETDDYVKAMKLIMWIGENIYYDHVAAETSVTMDTVAVHNVLERRRTTCAGFANTYSALLEIAGIRSVNLKGAAVAGEITYPELPTGTENHEFSAFWYEEEERWVYCDACWTSNSHYRDGEYKSEISNGTKYFDVTDQAFALNHRIDKAEERFYTKALDAVESLEGGESETEKDAKTEAESISPENTEADETKVTEINPDTASTQSSPQNNEENGEKADISPTPYIIIGLIGVMVIGAGIILAVQKNKK